MKSTMNTLLVGWLVASTFALPVVAGVPGSEAEIEIRSDKAMVEFMEGSRYPGYMHQCMNMAGFPCLMWLPAPFGLFILLAGTSLCTWGAARR